MSYPFAQDTVNTARKVQCMMPHEVDNINSYLECTALVREAQLAAAARARIRQRPQDLQFADWFNTFIHADRAVSTREVRPSLFDGANGTFQYWGGCKLLMQPKTKDAYWPVAREALRDQLFRFHAGQMSAFQGDAPGPAIVQCAIKDGQPNCL